jgi:hypothetical protein
MPRQSIINAPRNATSARDLRRSWRRNELQRTHQQLHNAADWITDADVDASPFAKIWIGVGLRIAASMLEELAAEMLVEDIINDN